MRLRKHKTFPHTKTKHTGKQASERARVRATNMDRAVRGEDCVIETVIGSATQTHTQIQCERHAKQCRGLAPHIIRIICSYCVASTQTNEQSSLWNVPFLYVATVTGPKWNAYAQTVESTAKRHPKEVVELSKHLQYKRLEKYYVRVSFVLYGAHTIVSLSIVPNVTTFCCVPFGEFLYDNAMLICSVRCCVSPHFSVVSLIFLDKWK